MTKENNYISCPYCEYCIRYEEKDIQLSTGFDQIKYYNQKKHQYQTLWLNKCELKFITCPGCKEDVMLEKKEVR